jgi:hypothetical protein
LRDGYLDAIHKFFGVVGLSGVVEAGHEPILEEDHPDLLPVGVVHGGVEGHELEVGLEWSEGVLQGVIEHGHVVVGDVGGNSRNPVDPGVQSIVQLVVPVLLLSVSKLVVGVYHDEKD